MHSSINRIRLEQTSNKVSFSNTHACTCTLGGEESNITACGAIVKLNRKYNPHSDLTPNQSKNRKTSAKRNCNLMERNFLKNEITGERANTLDAQRNVYRYAVTAGSFYETSESYTLYCSPFAEINGGYVYITSCFLRIVLRM